MIGSVLSARHPRRRGLDKATDHPSWLEAGRNLTHPWEEDPLAGPPRQTWSFPVPKPRLLHVEPVTGAAAASGTTF